MTQPLLQAADLRGAACLTTDAVAGIACLVEAMRSGDAAFDDERYRATPQCTDTNDHGVRHPVDCSAETSLRWLECALTEGNSQQAARPEREGLVAALNGVLGDYLAADFPAGRRLLCVTDQVAAGGARMAACYRLAQLTSGTLALLSSAQVRLAVLPPSNPGVAFLHAEGWRTRYRDQLVVVLTPPPSGL